MVISLFFHETRTSIQLYTHTSNWLAYVIVCVQTCAQDLTVPYITNQSKVFEMNVPVLSNTSLWPRPLYLRHGAKELLAVPGVMFCYSQSTSAIPSLKFLALFSGLTQPSITCRTKKWFFVLQVTGEGWTQDYSIFTVCLEHQILRRHYTLRSTSDA